MDPTGARTAAVGDPSGAPDGGLGIGLGPGSAGGLGFVGLVIPRIAAPPWAPNTGLYCPDPSLVHLQTGTRRPPEKSARVSSLDFLLSCGYCSGRSRPRRPFGIGPVIAVRADLLRHTGPRRVLTGRPALHAAEGSGARSHRDTVSAQRGHQ